MVKIKVTEIRKLRKWPISKYPCRYACNQKTSDFDTPRQYLNFSLTDFDIRRRSASRDLQTIRVFHLRQTNFASYEESTGSPVRAYLFVIMLIIKTKYFHEVECNKQK